MKPASIVVLTWLTAAGAIAGAAPGAPVQDEAIARFKQRVDAYVELHRLVEGPIPPLAASDDIEEVRRLMSQVRQGIVAARRQAGHEPLFDRNTIEALRSRIASCLSAADILELDLDVRDHAPADLKRPVALAPLPEEAPFVPLPPELLQRLPRLPPELRYVVLDRSLLVWDHHADLVVDVARGLLDPGAYRQ